MNDEIKNVAVVGAGVMGAQLAVHLANFGLKVLLLDILPQEKHVSCENVSDTKWRNMVADAAIVQMKSSKPPAFFSEKVFRNITAGNIDDHLDKIAGCDWVLEAVPERLDLKRSVYEQLEKYLRPETIVSSNTSGISLSLLLEGRSELFSRSFLITHFFNPVRYMKLVELVIPPNMDEKRLKAIKNFLTEKMGKGVVVAKDTPSFVANRIGVYTVMTTINKTFGNDWPIDLVDAVMGSPVSFAKSAIFRTTDLVGTDTLLHVAKNTREHCPHDKRINALIPDRIFETMVAEGRLGVKTGVGFYKKAGRTILVYEPKSGEYREKTKYEYESLKVAKKNEDPADRLKKIYGASDFPGEIAREIITDILNYVSLVGREISNSILDIDNAMKWGYNWELGPFEMMDAIGLEVLGSVVPGLATELRDKGFGSFYKYEGGKRFYFDFHSGDYSKIEEDSHCVSLGCIKSVRGVVGQNDSAALVDVGDGILCCEFHSKMNSIDTDTIAILNSGMDLLDSNKYQGMIIYNDGASFSVGANLFMIALSAGAGNFLELEAIIKKFQDVGMRMRFSKKPVVVAPFGRALGGGCEICLAACKTVAAAESYIGLVELGVGLIPAGGGCKNLLLRMQKRLGAGGPTAVAADVFKKIGMAVVSQSAPNAVELGYMSPEDEVVANRQKLLGFAKSALIKLLPEYKPPVYVENLRLPGRGGEMAFRDRLKNMRLKGEISDYDVTLASKLAHVLCGGDVATDHFVDEQHILDLEREAFLNLCGNQKTRDRIEYMLKNGSVLRN